MQPAMWMKLQGVRLVSKWHGDYSQERGISLSTKYRFDDSFDIKGWSSTYYKLPPNATELQDLIEYRNMSFSVGNIFKAAYRMGQKGIVYDLNKIIWFAKRELRRIT